MHLRSIVTATARQGQHRRSELLELVRKFRAVGYHVHPTGSTYFYDAGHDLDLLILGDYDTVGEFRCAGFVECANGEYPDDRQWTGRAGPINVIVCLDAEYFEAWVRATVATAMLAYTGVQLTRDQRGCLFKAVVDFEHPVEELQAHAYSTVPWGKCYAS